MSVSVSMPQLGESVTEGTVTRWLKKEGERVEADEPLLEVSTNKVDTEIPSPAAGVLRGISVGEDETVEVGAQLAVIEESADAPADGSGAPGGPAEPAPAPASSQAEPAAPEPAAPSPAAPSRPPPSRVDTATTAPAPPPPAMARPPGRAAVTVFPRAARSRHPPRCPPATGPT